jgi:hypothetical protein
MGRFMRIAPLLENNTVIQRVPLELPKGSVTDMGKIGEITWKHVETGTGLPKQYNPNLTPKENYAGWRQLGDLGHKAVDKIAEFADLVKNRTMIRNSRQRPDGWMIDKVNRVIRIAETKALTRSGIQRGIKELGKYMEQVEKMYPSKDGWMIQTELYTYRMVGVIQDGETLSHFASSSGTTVEELMKLNPQIKKADEVKPGDKINIEVKVEVPVSAVNCPDCS